MHPLIVHRERKVILKTLALALTLWALPTLAGAADLVVGVVHDADGFPVAGARVTLRQAGGGPAGSGQTAADGTFAIDASGDAATADIRCTYCLGMTVKRVPGVPVVAIVRRFAALRDRGISAADARVLPYGSATALASLMPYVVGTRGTLSDRGLAGGRGTIISDGFGLYRATDGVDLSAAIPDHGTATIAESDPTAANAYDANSAGGLFSIDTLDQSAGLVRVDGSTATDVAIRGGNDLRGSFATNGGTSAATRGVLDGTLAAGGGTLDLRALAATGMDANGNGFATTFTVPVRTAFLAASVSMSRTADANGPENDGIAALSLQAGAITYGVRGQRTTGLVVYGTGAQDDLRAYAQAGFNVGTTHIFASLAAAQAGETLLRRPSSLGALLPIVSVMTHLSPAFDVHADSVAALLAAPLYEMYALPNGTALGRSQLLDAGFGFDDGNRLRIDVMAFRQTVSGGGYGTTAGSGVSSVWQIAPSLALRSWFLISSNSGGYSGAYDDYYGAPAYDAPGAMNLDRNVTWLTAGNVLRVDAIWRSGRLEGDVSVPAAPHLRFVAGTRRDGTSRVYTAGLSWP